MTDFVMRDLSVLNYAQGFTLWHYKAVNVADALRPGFFNPMQDMIAHADVIVVTSPQGGAQLWVGKKLSGVFVKPMMATETVS